MTTTCTTVFNLNDSQSLELDSSTEMESKGATPTSSKGKRQLPSVPVLGSPMHACLKTVTFNSELRKASVGGTESVGEIRPESLSVSLNFDSTDGNSGTCSKIQIKSPSKSSKENTDPNEVFLFPENDVEGSDLKSEISNFSKSSTPLVHICEKKITCQRNGKDNWSVSEETRCKNVKTPNKTPTIKTPLRTPATDGKFKVASGNLSARSNKSFTTPGNTDSFSTPAKEPRRVTIEGTPIPCPDFLEGELPSPSVMRTPVLTPSRRYTLDDRIIKTPECYSTVQMDLNGYDVLYGRDRLADGEDSSSVTVAVRVRPFMPRELLEEKVPRCIVSMNGNETTVTTDSGVVHQFTYDFSFWSVDANHGKYDGQENVYKMLAQPLLGKAFEGYNTCLFAYGQTGSGKSYSIMGHGNEIGIIPRFCEELFSRAEVTRDSDENVFKRTGVNINVEISFFEIYNEKIHDLLASSKEKGGKKPTLRVREHPVLGPYVEGLSTYVTNSFEDVQGWINLGNKNRATAATGMNDKSSRSHSVFTLVLTQTRTDEIEGQEHEHSITSKINLVDLAGSERQSLAQTSGQRLREGANINKSLLTLGKVISALSEQNPNVARKKKLFIPYRDSVLTWLLKESLGGNSKTAMIATISPSIHHIEETLSTLRYANQARTIVNLARVNEDPKAKIIRELRDEIDRLKSQSMYMSDDVHTASLMEIATLREKLLSKEKEMEEMTRSWQHRFKQSEQRKVEEAKMLEKAGITFKVDNKLPNLVNLNEDPQLSDLLLYVIKEGQTRVGRMCAGSGHEIQLNGALIADDHCIINNEGSLVSITPIGDAQTYVNGNLISEPVILHHGDRVIVGGDHYFRFNHPHEVRNKATSGSQEMKDFDFARQELLQVQEARLQHELEEARKKAQEEVEKARREAEEELNSQKTGYEEKLVELEKTLKDQTLEALKALQSRQEAEDTIQQLKQQKMILEQEVVAGRRRQEIEAKAAQKVSLMYGEKSKLLILLETERKKVQQRIQEMKQRKSETASPCRRYQSAENQLPGKTDLYKVALLIREANKIGQFLKKNMEFSREDYMEEESTKTLIKVTDTKLSVCTYWTVPKFEEKLMQMRDMYQNETDGVGDDQVFHDPGDNWEYDEKSSPLRSPKGRVSFMRSNSRSFLSSVSSSIDSPFKIQGDRTSPTDVAVVDQETQTNSTASMAALCRGILLDDLEKYNAYYFEESVADKVLHMCEMLVRDVQKLADGSHAHRVTFAGLDISQDMQSTCVQVLNQVQLLTSQCAVWSSSVSQGRSKSSATTDIFLKLQELVKAMRSHIVLLFQGFENGLDGLVQEACNNVKDSASSICRLAGELSLVTSTPVLSLDEEADEGETIHLSPFVSQSFLAGCDTQVDRHLQKSIKALEECEERMQKLVETAANNLDLGEIPQNVSILICTCKLLLSICQEVQVEVDSSMRESLDLFPGQYYSLGYQRLQGMMGNVDKLMESISLLMQNIQPVVDGKERDLRKLCRCAELIQKGAARLLESATRDVKNYQDTTCSSFTDLSVLTDTQTEQLEFATQDINLAANSLIANAMKIVEHENFSVTPRKRMLPASPNKSVIGSPYSPMRTTPSSKS